MLILSAVSGARNRTACRTHSVVPWMRGSSAVLSSIVSPCQVFQYALQSAPSGTSCERTQTEKSYSRPPSTATDCWMKQLWSSAPSTRKQFAPAWGASATTVAST